MLGEGNRRINKQYQTKLVSDPGSAGEDMNGDEKACRRSMQVGEWGRASPRREVVNDCVGTWWFPVRVPPLAACSILGKLINPSEPQFPHL